MAEWILLILVAIVVTGTYFFNHRVYQSQSLLVWAGAGLILAVSLIAYIFSKVNAVGQPWAEQYDVETEP